MKTIGNIYRQVVLASVALVLPTSCQERTTFQEVDSEAISVSLTHPRVTTIAEDTTGHVWIGTSHGLNRSLTYGYHQYFAGCDSLSLQDNHISRLVVDGEGHLWVGFVGGSLGYLTEEGVFRQVGIEYHGNSLMSFLEIEGLPLLCNNEKGIYILDKDGERMERVIDGEVRNFGFFPGGGRTILVVYRDCVKRYSLPDGAAMGSIPLDFPCGNARMDPRGNLWLSTGGGDSLTILSADSFGKMEVPASLVRKSREGMIREILPFEMEDDGRFLVNTRKDLVVYDIHSGEVLSAREAGLPFDVGQYSLNCIFYDSRGNLWIGTDGDGVHLLPSGRRGNALHSMLDFFRQKPITALEYDSGRDAVRVTVGENDVYLYGISERRVLEHYVQSVVQDKDNIRPGVSLFKERVLHLSDGGLLSARGNMDLILSAPRGEVASVISFSAIREALGSDLFIPETLMEDSRGNVWIGTQSDGVLILEAGTHRLHKVQEISCPEISSIEEDSSGHVWVATQYGLNEYDTSWNLVDSYFVGEGISSNAFTENCSCTIPGGILLFGTMQGIVERYPSSAERRLEVPFYFEDLRVQNNLVRPGKDSPIGRAMVFSPSIRLRHDQNNFSISFSSLDYRNTIRGSYSYRLEGFDNIWIDAGDAHEAFYSNIPPGRYTFSARLSDRSGNTVWGSASVPIRVVPAPWESWWARLAYLLGAVALLSYLFLSYRRHSRARQELQRIETEKRQEQHMSEINKQYFANVAHQLRTPLTMISGPIDTLCDTPSIKGTERSLLRIVRHNVGRMLQMVNQIMDFNALETDALSLKVRRYDILPLLRNTLDIYRVNADEKGVHFLSDGLEGNSFVYVDADKIVNILDNLLSNAMKFTPQGGVISVTYNVKDGEASLEVSNSGPTIPEDKLEKIFERYYQLDGSSRGRLNWGSGVGLYYSRRLSELHHGTLVCRNSEDGEGVRFILTVPVLETSYEDRDMDSGTPSELPSPAQGIQAFNEEDSEAVVQVAKPYALVVDDDTDITFYLRSLLSPQYQVTCCYDAESARASLGERMPDIILSDVLMTGQSGFDFCRSLKDDLQYCHIPVVLLTAKDSVKDQIDGLNVGADAYVTKPFNAQYLLSLLDNLLKGRARLRKALSENAGLDLPGDGSISSQDREFLSEVYSMMEKELSNSEFNIGDIVDGLHMSHAKFIYKIKGLTGTTPSELFKNYKLNKAAAMLREGKYNVSEVSDLTGFSSLAHFSKVFKKKFGVPPSGFGK